MNKRGFIESDLKFKPGDLPDYWEYFSYTNGQLVWAKSGKNRRVGCPAGSLRADGYSEVHFDGNRERVHRVIWKMHFGKIPVGFVIDHINRDPTDNRLDNLRCIPKRLNHHNLKPIKAHHHKKSGKWTSRIRRFGKNKNLGYFDTQKAAVAAYEKARKDLDAFDEYTFFGENNPPVGQGEKPRQTEAQAAQVAYCKRLLMEGWNEAYLIGLGYAAGAIKQAKEQIK